MGHRWIGVPISLVIVECNLPGGRGLVRGFQQGMGGKRSGPLQLEPLLNFFQREFLITGLGTLEFSSSSCGKTEIEEASPSWLECRSFLRVTLIIPSARALRGSLPAYCDAKY